MLCLSESRVEDSLGHAIPKRLVSSCFFGSQNGQCLPVDVQVYFENFPFDGDSLGEAQAQALCAQYRAGGFPDVLWRDLARPCPALPDKKEQQVQDVRGWLERCDPDLLLEIEGFARGFNIPLTETLLYLTGWGFQPSIMQGCSQVGILCQATEKGKPLVGRNYDFHPDLWERRLVSFRASRGFSSIGSSQFVVGRLEGINSAGLYVGMSFAHGRNTPNGISGGFFFSTIVRIVLDQAKNLSEAVSLIQALPHSSPYNYLVVDESGKGAVVEVGLSRVAVRPACRTDAIHTTNHFVDPTMADQQARKMENSEIRYKLIEKWCQKHKSEISVEQIKKLLATKYPHGLAVPWYNEFLGTLYSMVADLGRRDLWISIGEPKRDGYRSVNWRKAPRTHQTTIFSGIITEALITTPSRE